MIDLDEPVTGREVRRAVGLFLLVVLVAFAVANVTPESSEPKAFVLPGVSLE